MQTNVETKKVLVTADDTVSPQDMLEKLQKVSLRVERRLSPFLCWIANSILLLAVVGSKWKVRCTCVTQVSLLFSVASQSQHGPNLLVNTSSCWNQKCL